MFNFDASTIAPQESFTPIPAGTYNAKAIKAEMRPLKSGNGLALAMTFQVIDGPHANRQVFANLNVQHANPEAQRIAQQQLSTLCHAVGALKLSETTLHQLLQKPVRIRVKVRQDPQYGDKNEINGFEAMPGVARVPGAPSIPAAAHPAAAVQQPAAAAVPPWAAQAA